MTLEETKKLLITINSMFPNWRVENPQETAAAWHWILKSYTLDAMMGALETYVLTDKSGFAPSVSQLIACIHKPMENEYLSESEAWAMVKKAIADGNYHSEERFAELPEVVQKAVGDASMLRQWAKCDSEDVNTVIMSNFQRAYRVTVQRQDFDNKVPQKVRDLLSVSMPKIGVTG